MNICWVSPLDPELTEIARYSVQILPFVEKYMGVSAVHDGDGAAPGWWDKRQEESAAEEGVAPLPIYHIGNNSLHLPVYRQALLEPGLVVLHDVSLVDLAKTLSRESDYPELWNWQMREQYGDDVDDLVISSENSVASHNEMVSSYPLFQPFVDNALGVVVHSRYAQNALLRNLPAGTLVKQLNLPAPAPPAIANRDYSARPLRFVFCGHLGPNRRLLEFFEAWGRLDSPGRINLELFGNIRNNRQLVQCAEQFGVADYLHFRGYVAERELEKALHDAHFAINLRWPTMGEASASQLRYWSAALPTLVTDVGWYGELPDGAVCKVSPEREIDDIHALLEDALASPEKYRQVGQRGWEYLCSQHSAETYARELASFAEELCNRRLAYRALDQELVDIIGSMCADGTDTALFRDAVETAAATFTPTVVDRKEIGL